MTKKLTDYEYHQRQSFLNKSLKLDWTNNSDIGYPDEEEPNETHSKIKQT